MNLITTATTNPRAAGAIGRPALLPAGFKSNRFGCVPKLCGADVELGNAILGLESTGSTGDAAAEAILKQIRKMNRLPSSAESDARSGYSSSERRDPQDRCRTWLVKNGACAYIDLDHAELCIPEVLSARDAVAALHAMFRLAEEAVAAANACLPEGQKIVALVNNTDGQGHSYGGHMNLLMKRETYESMFEARPQYMLFLAAFQVSSIILTGGGKVGSENGAPPVPYQISQRADFFEKLRGPQTTIDRPIINTRDESLCGFSRTWANGACAADHLARLHVIFYDSTLCHVSTYLRFGMMQIVLAMIEAGQISPELLLEDPLTALRTWSHDPGLQARARLAGGAEITAVDHQRRLLDAARRFVEEGGCVGVVPDAVEILNYWGRALDGLARRDFAALARWLDWVLKLAVLEAVRRQHGLDWHAPELKQLDFQFSSLGNGLYWIYEREGAVDRIVSDGAVERFIHEPPSGTRAWTRSALLRCAGPDCLDDVDWDRVRFHVGRAGVWPGWRSVHLANPLGFTRADCESIFTHSHDLHEILDRLDELADIGGVATAGETVNTDVGPVPLHLPRAVSSNEPSDVTEAGQLTDEKRKEKNA